MIYLEVNFKSSAKYYRFSSISKANLFIVSRHIDFWCMTDKPMIDDTDKEMTDEEYEFIE